MFPQTSLMLGSSLLWSAAPLVACPLLTAFRFPPSLPVKIREELRQIVDSQRAASRISQYEEDCRIFAGLRIMLESGDRRVLSFGELVYPLPREKGTNVPPKAERLRTIVLAHADLIGEALLAYESNPTTRWEPGQP